MEETKMYMAAGISTLFFISSLIFYNNYSEIFIKIQIIKELWQLEQQKFFKNLIYGGGCGSYKQYLSSLYLDNFPFVNFFIALQLLLASNTNHFAISPLPKITLRVPIYLHDLKSVKLYVFLYVFVYVWIFMYTFYTYTFTYTFHIRIFMYAPFAYYFYLFIYTFFYMFFC